MGFLSQLDWHPNLLDPTGERQGKPRQTGKTMIIDKGLGIRAFKDLLETAGTYMDMIKIGFGTSVLYPREILEQKIQLAKKHNVSILPGGTFLEVAIRQNVIRSFFDVITSLHFDSIEISDGTIDISKSLRNELIKRSIDNGLTVYTEYGKKDGTKPIEISEMVEAVYSDLEQGAQLVTVEARESGVGVGLFDEQGQCQEEDIFSIAQHFPDFGKSMLLWETPLKSQQSLFIKTLGGDVNLGNIAPQDIIAVEALRRGLRSDTFVK